MLNKEEYFIPYIYPKLQNKQKDTLTVSVPGSKSITNRGLLMATLANGTSTLTNVLFSDDSRHFIQCIQALGFSAVIKEEEKTVIIKGQSGKIPLENASIYVGSAGTAARFLTAFLGISKGCYDLDASPQMRKRPMAPLLSSLEALGCEITYDSQGKEGYFPFSLKGNGFCQNTICIDIDNSSQFLSALLISSCLCREGFTIQVKGTHGMSYITMTMEMMKQFGVAVQQKEENLFFTPPGQSYCARSYEIEPDLSAACYFYAMSPLLNIPVMVSGVHSNSLQGDLGFLSILEEMGCTIEEKEKGILLLPPKSGQYQGVTVDMSSCSDQAITLAAIAPFASSPTTITGIGHIRFQECNRLQAIVNELSKMGIRCDCTETSITIYPGVPKPSTIETYQDHRMAMGFSLGGLRSPNMILMDPDCCGKTFENYFETLELALAQIQL